MIKEDRDIQRKLKVLRHAEKIGDVGKTCRYFGIGRSSFYRWKASFEQNGEAGLINANASYLSKLRSRCVTVQM